MNHQPLKTSKVTNSSILRDTYHLLMDRFLIEALCMLSFAGCFWPSTNLAKLIRCVLGMGEGAGTVVWGRDMVGWCVGVGG